MLFNLWACHYDTYQWKDPEVFNIRRWLDADGKCVSGNDRSYFPFGGGRRNCLGESMAKEEMFLFFTRIIRSFKIKRDLDKPLPIIGNGTLGVTFSPKAYTAKFIARDV